MCQLSIILLSVGIKYSMRNLHVASVTVLEAQSCDVHQIL